jgi:hypothetical protein
MPSAIHWACSLAKKIFSLDSVELGQVLKVIQALFIGYWHCLGFLRTPGFINMSINEFRYKRDAGMN